MNWEQVKGIVERIATVAVTYAAAKGYISQGVTGDIVTIVVLVGGVIWGWKVNTKPSLEAAAKQVP